MDTYAQLRRLGDKKRREALRTASNNFEMTADALLDAALTHGGYECAEVRNTV